MAHADFSERLSRLKTVAAPQAEMVPLKDAPVRLPEQARINWQIIIGIVLGLVLVPLAFAARIDLQVVAAPGLSMEPAYYLTAMGFTLGFHLILFAMIIVALAQRFKRLFLNIIILELMIGYGLAAAFLAFAAN